MLTTETADLKNFNAKVLHEKEKLVIVYFWGHPCPNCEEFERRWTKLRSHLPADKVRWVKVNAYEETELAHRFGLFGVPSFFVFREGKLIGKMTSFEGDEFFLGVVRDLLSARDQPAA